MRLEDEHVHYRARFVVWPFAITDESPFFYILDVLQEWLTHKEWFRVSDGENGSVYNALVSTQQDLSKEGMTKSSCSVSKTFASGMEIPSGYSGGLNVTRATRLCTSAEKGSGSAERPQYWAMEYDEPSSDTPFRHWHTSVGVTRIPVNDGKSLDSDSPCVVNVRVTNYMLPNYSGPVPPQVESSTPRFVEGILSLKDFQSCVGETPVKTKPVHLDATSFREDFMTDLVSPDRQLPMVLVGTDELGQPPIDNVDKFAQKLLGMANVYVLDFSDKELRDAHYEAFRRGEPSFDFRCGRDYVRVYQPRIDLNSERDSTRHRFYLKRQIDSEGAGFPDSVARSLTHSKLRDERDVIDVQDIDRMRAQAEVLRLKARFESQAALTNTARKAESDKLSGKPVVDAAAYADLQATLQEAISGRDTWEDLANDAQGKILSQQDELSMQKRSVNNLEALLAEKDNALRDVQNKCDALQASFDESKASRTMPSQERLLDKMKNLPDDIDTMLQYFEESYPDRIVVLEDAHESARECESLDARDEWETLWTIPNVLWGLCFAEDRSYDFEREFQERTGHELALTESKLTKANKKIMRQRKVRYKGAVIEVIAHVKGRSGKEEFRIHYDVDKNDKKIVIGLCVNHLDTSRTHSMH